MSMVLLSWHSQCEIAFDECSPSATIHTHHWYLLLLLGPKGNTRFTVPPRVKGRVDLGTAVNFYPGLYIAIAIAMNTTDHSTHRIWSYDFSDYTLLLVHCYYTEQNTNVGNSRVTIQLWRTEVRSTETDFGHFRSLQQQANGSNRLARYDFLIGFIENLSLSGTIVELQLTSH